MRYSLFLGFLHKLLCGLRTYPLGGHKVHRHRSSWRHPGASLLTIYIYAVLVFVTEGIITALSSCANKDHMPLNNEDRTELVRSITKWLGVKLRAN